MQKHIDGTSNEDLRDSYRRQQSEYRDRYGDLLIRPTDTRSPNLTHENPGSSGVDLKPALAGKPVHVDNSLRYTGNNNSRYGGMRSEGKSIPAPSEPNVIAKDKVRGDDGRFISNGVPGKFNRKKEYPSGYSADVRDTVIAGHEILDGPEAGKIRTEDGDIVDRDNPDITVDHKK